MSSLEKPRMTHHVGRSASPPTRRLAAQKARCSAPAHRTPPQESPRGASSTQHAPVVQTAKTGRYQSDPLRVGQCGSMVVSHRPANDLRCCPDRVETMIDSFVRCSTRWVGPPEVWLPYALARRRRRHDYRCVAAEELQLVTLDPGPQA